jgi:anti-anti-sigma factor
MQTGLGISVAQLSTTATVVSVAGDVDLAAAADLYSPAVTAFRSYGLRRLIFDFADVSFLDCAGISTLLAIAQSARSRGAVAVLVNCRPLVLRILRLAGVADVLVG